MYFLLGFVEQLIADVIARLSGRNQIADGWYLLFIPTDLQAVKLEITGDSS